MSTTRRASSALRAATVRCATTSAAVSSPSVFVATRRFGRGTRAKAAHPTAKIASFASTNRGFAASTSGGNRRANDSDAKNADFAKYLFALVAAVVGATYASVPLYRMFCRATGFGGTTQRATLEDKLASDAWSAAQRDEAAKREITITFNADVAEGMPWRFTPTQKSIKVRPGESALAFYTARNLSRTPVTGVATYNVQPNKVGVYFNKVQCFCFEEQRLRGKEEVDMPVLFYIDPEFASDPSMADVKSLVLSYTFFKSDDFDDDEDDEDGDSSSSSSSGVRLHGPGVSKN